jgi:hypothetical protein
MGRAATGRYDSGGDQHHYDTMSLTECEAMTAHEQVSSMPLYPNTNVKHSS